MSGAPAGQVLPTEFVDDAGEAELRIAFDFDGIVADDSAETIFKSSGLAAFLDAEAEAAAVPMPAGPLGRFFREVAKLQQKEHAKKTADRSLDVDRLHHEWRSNSPVFAFVLVFGETNGHLGGDQEIRKAFIRTESDVPTYKR